MTHSSCSFYSYCSYSCCCSCRSSYRWESVKVRNIAEVGISPKVLDVVESTKFGQENVDNDIGIVHRNPSGLAQPIHCQRLCSCPGATGVAYRVCLGLYLLGRTARTDNKIAANSIGNLRQVCHNNIASLFILKSCHNGIYQLILRLLHSL